VLLNYLTRRPFYASDGSASGSGATDPATSAETKTTDTPPEQEHMIPKSRFDEVNQKLQALQADQQKREAAEKAKAEKDAAARGEWERLATERQAKLEAAEQGQQTAAERLTAYEAEMERQIKARLRALPEELRALIPEGDALTRYTQLEKVEAAATKLAATRTPGTPSGPRGTGAAGSVATTNDDLIAKKRASIGGL
jgi:hypothetical protein